MFGTVLRDEDFKQHWTDFPQMDDEAFFLFWLRYNFGGEVVEIFEPVGPWGYIHRGVIHRRNGTRDIVDMLLEHVVVINLDRAPSPVVIPPEVWTYAFEVSPTATSLEISPMSTVKVAFTSFTEGFVLKVPAGTLLLLAQAKVDITRLTAADLKTLAAAWEPVLRVQQEMDEVANRVRNEGTSVDALGAALLIPKDAISTLASVFALENTEAPRALACFVEEYWKLVVIRASEGGEGTAVAGAGSGIKEPGTIPPGEAATGDEFRWVPQFIRRLPDAASVSFQHDFAWATPPARFRDLFWDILESWHDPTNTRIRRSTRVGDDFSLNTTYAHWAFPGDASWKTLAVKFPRIPAAVAPRLNKEAGEFPLAREIHCEVPAESSLIIGAVAIPRFVQFYKSIVGEDHEARLAEWFPGCLAFLDIAPDGTATSILVKLNMYPQCFRGYIVGLCGLRALLNFSATRYFAFDPNVGCTEYDSGLYRQAAKDWIGAAWPVVVQGALEVLQTRKDQSLNVTFLLGDALTNITVGGVGMHALGFVRGSWQFSSEAGALMPLYSPEDLALAQRSLGMVVEGEDAEDAPGPFRQYLYSEELRKGNPELYKAIGDQIDAGLGDWRRARFEEFLAEKSEDDERVGKEFEKSRRWELGEDEEG